jgi:hypothetical protein
MGTGPETFALAVNRFVSPRLGQLEDRGATPDRAHSEAFDLLVMQGVLGLAIWLGVLGAVIGSGLRTLKLIESRRDAVGFWASYLGGAAVGASAPLFASGEAALAGVGLSIGLVLGLALFVTLQALLHSRRGTVTHRASPVDALVVAILATVIAHVVEVQVGIAVTSTRLHFWVLAAALVVAARGLLDIGSDGSQRPLAKTGRASSRSAGTRDPGRPAERQMTHHSAGYAAVVLSLLVAALCLPWVYSMTSGPRGASTVGEVIAYSWLARDGTAGPGGISPLVWLVVTTVVVAGVVGAAARSSRDLPMSRYRLLSGLIVLGTVGLFAIAQAGQVALAARRAASPSGLLAAAELSANLYSVFVWSTVLLCLVIGVLLGLREGKGAPFLRSNVWICAVTAAAICAGGVALIQRYNIDPIRADVLMKTAGHLFDAGRVDDGIVILDRAVDLDPAEPMLQLNRGGMVLKAAVAAHDGAHRDELLGRAEASLDRARALAPLDPDHSANLARLHTTRASLETDPERRAVLMQRASEEYGAALLLRPTSVVLLNERGRLLLNMGHADEAFAELQRAVDLDPEYAEPYVALGALWERSAAVASSRGDRQHSLEYLESAAAMYRRALHCSPDHETAREGLARVRRAVASVRGAGSS